MGVSSALFDAVDVLRARIYASAATADPEQLAYLGSAIEKIAGHVTLLELSEHVDTLKTTLDAYKTKLEADFATDIGQQGQIAMEAITQTKSAYLSELLSQQRVAQTAITESTVTSTQAIKSAMDAIELQVATVLAEIAAAISTAKGTAETVKAVQPYNEADLMYFTA